MTKFYVDDQGGYIGGYDGAEPPARSIEVATAPNRASDKWTGAVWVGAVVVPQEVTRRQGLQALYLNGVTEAMIEAEIGKMLPPKNSLALIEFRASQVFERNRELVISMGAVFALDLDAIFIQAAGLD